MPPGSDYESTNTDLKKKGNPPPQTADGKVNDYHEQLDNVSS
jgi:hypothetical protein